MSERPRRMVWLILGLIALHACMATTRVTASLWVLREGYEEWVVGWVLSLFAVAPILLSLWAGRLADRRGLAVPVRVSVAMAVLGTVGSAIHPHLLTVALASLAAGGALSVAAVAIQREAGLMGSNGDALKRIFSWIALGPALSNTLAPLICGLLIDHLGMQWSFAWAVVLPLLAWGLLHRVGTQPGRSPTETLEQGAIQPARREPVWTLLRLPGLRLLLFINVSMAAAWDAHTFAVPVMGHARAFSASEVGLVLAAFATAATVVRLVIVRWAHRLDARRMLQAAMGLAATVLALYAYLPNLALLMLGSAVLGLALGSVQPMVLTLLHQATPVHRHGQALGLRMTITNAATVTMPLAFGLLSAAWLLSLPLLLMAAWLLAASWKVAQVWKTLDPSATDGER